MLARGRRIRPQSPKGRTRSIEDALDRKRLRECAVRCVRCRAPEFQLHHVIGRGRLDVRHDPENHLALCIGCHGWFHAHPTEAKIWFVAEFAVTRPRIAARVSASLRAEFLANSPDRRKVSP